MGRRFLVEGRASGNYFKLNREVFVDISSAMTFISNLDVDISDMRRILKEHYLLDFYENDDVATYGKFAQSTASGKLCFYRIPDLDQFKPASDGKDTVYYFIAAVIVSTPLYQVYAKKHQKFQVLDDAKKFIGGLDMPQKMLPEVYWKETLAKNKSLIAQSDFVDLGYGAKTDYYQIRAAELIVNGKLTVIQMKNHGSFLHEDMFDNKITGPPPGYYAEPVGEEPSPKDVKVEKTVKSESKPKGRIYGGKTLPCGGRDSTNCKVYKDPATVHKDNEPHRKPVVIDGEIQPLEGTSGRPKKIPNPSGDLPNKVATRKKYGKTYKVNKCENLMPEFTIFETYIGDEHINSGRDYEHIQAANLRMKELLLENPDLEHDMGFTPEQMEFFLAGTPRQMKFSPPGLRWHHHQDAAKMQLVDETLHERFGHSGGMNTWGGGRG